MAGVALIPVPIEVFRGGAELDDQDAGQVLRFDLSSFLAPEPDQGSLVVPHDDPSIGATNEFATIS